MTPRLSIIVLCSTMIFCFACKPKQDSQQVWIVAECGHAEDLFKPRDKITFSDTHIYILQSEKSFPIVKDETQLIITVNENKRLFHFTKSDSLITLTEQYETPQATITLKKYTP